MDSIVRNCHGGRWFIDVRNVDGKGLLKEEPASVGRSNPQVVSASSFEVERYGRLEFIADDSEHDVVVTSGACDKRINKIVSRVGIVVAQGSDFKARWLVFRQRAVR